MISATRATLILAATWPAILLLLLWLAARMIRGEAADALGPETVLLLGAEYMLLAGLTFAVLEMGRKKIALRMKIAETLRREIESEQLRATLLTQPKYQDPKRLGQFAHKAYSQFGEDGIIAEVFRRIGMTNRYFVEFGCGDGTENNSVLLKSEGWSGIWLEANERHVAAACSRHADAVAQGRLQIAREFVSAESIEILFANYGVPTEFDLLSIDIDRNDFYVWKAIVRYRPRLVVIEFNGIFPPSVDWVVEYAPRKTWDGTSRTGASLKALERLGREKGYSLVACDLAGVNAFFVRDDLVADAFSAPFTAENHFEPPRYWLAWGGHVRSP